MLSTLNGTDAIRVMVDITRAAIATGLNISTYFKSLRRLKLAKPISRISLNIFSFRSNVPVFSDLYQKDREIHHKRHPLLIRRILMILKIKLQKTLFQKH
jgi:hypothetical protein